MLTLLTVIHLVIAIAMIVFVMLQDPKGGGAFGIGATSGTQGIFGASGAGNFLVSATKWLAVLFAATCLTLSYLTVVRETSVTEGYQAPAAQAQPADANAPAADATVPAADAAALPAKEEAKK